MALRCVEFCLIAFAIAPLQGQPMFEGASGFGEETLKGRPKIIKVERENLGDKSLLQPEEQSTYRQDGKLSSQQRYVDGKLVANEIFEYDANGHRSAVTTRNAEDKIIQIASFHLLPDQSEEETDTAGGKQLSRTIRRFDAKERVTELKRVETDGDISTIMQFDYDDRGRPVEARLRMEGENLSAIERATNGVAHSSPTPASQATIRLEIIYPGDNQAIVTVYDFSGKIAFQLQTTEDGVGNQMDQILFTQEPQGKQANSVRVEHTDETGNWTLKTLLERNPGTQVDVPVARLHRSIVYY
jgi:hypothetical protein